MRVSDNNTKNKEIPHMITRFRIRNFKRLEKAELELGNTAVFIGPNNSGKTTALQAMALWDVGWKRWAEKRGKRAPGKRPGVTINRRDLSAIPIPRQHKSCVISAGSSFLARNSTLGARS
jgi:hypothetical protein